MANLTDSEAIRSTREDTAIGVLTFVLAAAVIVLCFFDMTEEAVAVLAVEMVAPVVLILRLNHRLAAVLHRQRRRKQTEQRTAASYEPRSVA